MQWIEIIKNFGLPLAGMLGLVFFLQKSIWPFILNRVDRAEARLDSAQTKFDTALERRDANAAETTKQLEKVSDNLRDLAEEIRRKR